jgi:hypothetical protein
MTVKMCKSLGEKAPVFEGNLRGRIGWWLLYALIERHKVLFWNSMELECDARYIIGIELSTFSLALSGALPLH